jgi:probable rRNA maturation factor
MRILNRQYRGVDRTTDVLSFPQQSAEERKSRGKARDLRTSGLQTLDYRPILGDIVVDLQRCKRQAREYGLTFDEELRRIVIHGLLHLVGYDHEESRYQKSKMESKEGELLQGLQGF